MLARRWVKDTWREIRDPMALGGASQGQLFVRDALQEFAK